MKAVIVGIKGRYAAALTGDGTMAENLKGMIK